MKHLAVLALALLAALPLRAQEDRAERERIKSERAAANQRYADEQKACRARFAVTDCLDKATRQHNATIAELKRQERVLNDADRKHRAAKRQQAIDEKSSPERQKEAAEKRAKAVEEQKEREARAAEKAAKRAEDDADRARRPPRTRTASGTPLPQGNARAVQAPKSNAPTPQEAAKNRAAYEARMKEAEQHRLDVASRMAKRTKPAASGLPAPK